MTITTSSQSAATEIKAKLARLDGLIKEFDDFYRILGNVLPEINLEIYKTYKKASATLELLTSQSGPGKIDNLIAAVTSHLQSAIIHVGHIMSQDEYIHRVIVDFSRELEEMSTKWNASSHANKEIPLPSQYTDLRHLHASVLDPLGQIISTENELARDLQRHVETELKSLEESLTSITLILVDLINRSDATKQPILRIMTSLQMHDIISQDLLTLRKSMAEAERILEQPSPEANDADFVTTALPLIDDVLNQIAAVFTRETAELRRETANIVQTITNERDDKILLSDFLLDSTIHKSTFDAILDEISDMLSEILNKLELLAARRWLLPGQLTSLLNLAEMLLLIADKYSVQLEAQFPGMQQVRSTLEEMISIKSDLDFYRLEELKEFVAEMESALTGTIGELRDIRTIMLDSIAGIDSYSTRCMNFLGEFLQTLELDHELTDSFISLSIEPINSELTLTCGEMSINCQYQQDLIQRLKRPHLSAVLNSESGAEDGLTVF